MLVLDLEELRRLLDAMDAADIECVREIIAPLAARQLVLGAVHADAIHNAQFKRLQSRLPGIDIRFDRVPCLRQADGDVWMSAWIWVAEAAAGSES